jgi:hypothetical protein
MKLTGENRSTRGKTCPSATLSTTNPTWTKPGTNPGLRGDRPAAKRVSHGTVYYFIKCHFLLSSSVILMYSLLRHFLRSLISFSKLLHNKMSRPEQTKEEAVDHTNSFYNRSDISVFSDTDLLLVFMY